MKKITIGFALFLTLLLFAQNALAQTPSPGRGTTGVNAKVGQFYLDISGYVSPHASIVMTTESVFMRSTLADAGGNFSISQIIVKSGFSSFCLEAIDFKRIGDSLTCFKIPPVTVSTSKRDIFLPPTLGLSGRKITKSTSVFAFGYTMPGARVHLHIGSRLVELIADKFGFYRTEIKNLPPGKYQLFATATYKNKDSEKPSRTLELESVSDADSIRQDISTFLERLIHWLLTTFITYIWIGLPILILIIILLSKKLRERLKRLIRRGGGDRAVFGKKDKSKHPLHHQWFMGY